jgi:voltage-gated potassium channel
MTFYQRAKQRVFEVLEVSRADDRVSRFVNRFLVVLILLNVAISILTTGKVVERDFGTVFRVVEEISVALFTLEYVLRIWCVTSNRRGRYRHPLWCRLRYLVTPYALIDLAAILPFLISAAIGMDLLVLRALRLLRLLKLTRYHSAWQTLTAVFVAQRRPFMMAGFLMALTLILASSFMYAIEHEAQPEKFADIPSAMWWAIVTLCTIGYGDVTPITPLGKVFGGLVSILGLVMYALPAGIMASGFVQELRKRQFVVTWSMVARVPAFSRLGADRIGEIAELLKPWEVPARYTIIRRGETGDSMYFIASGEVEVDIPPKPFILTAGDFFGEIALLHKQTRLATVTSITDCQLLILDAYDFERLVRDNPELRDELLATARERLHTSAGRIAKWSLVEEPAPKASEPASSRPESG